MKEQNSKADCATIRLPDSWHRIELLIRHYRLPSVASFAREIGFNSTKKLYVIKSTGINIDRDLADTIRDRFPAINLHWLLTGEGAMITEVSDRE